MTRKKASKLSSKVWLPIVVALIACSGTVIAALIGSDAIKEIVTRLLPRPNISVLTVRVSDKAGKAISGAKVLLFASTGSVSQYTDSNGAATFFVERNVQGNRRVIVESEDYDIYEEQITDPLESSVDIRLNKSPGTDEKIVLRTVNETDGIPIDNVGVIVTFNGEIHRETTDSDGFAVYTLPFNSEGKLDVQISVNAPGYNIENQFSTLTPGKLQYILLTPNSLRVEIPNIPAPQINSAPVNQETPAGSQIDTAELIGSGVNIGQQTGGHGIKVVFLTPDAQPWKNIYIEVSEQITDASGNPSRGNRVAYDYVNEQGQISFEMQDGLYAVCSSEKTGYGWTKDDCVYNVQVSANRLTVVTLQGGQIEIAVVGADGKPWKDVYVEVFTQKQDVNGAPVSADRVWYGYTANTGIANPWLTPGLYAVSINLQGYNWGKLSDRKGEVNIAVQKGNKTSLVIKMGRIAIGLRNPDGSPHTGAYLEVFTQQSDVNNQSVTADRIWTGYTDNGGFASVDLTEGLYTLKIGDQILHDLPVNWGKVTETDGKTHQQK